MSIADDLDKIKKVSVEQNAARILTIDIETSPSLAYVWSLWDENIPLDRLLIPGDILCFAAKWFGEEEIIFYSSANGGYEKMIYALWDLFNEADIVITYNGDAFDIKHINRTFILMELSPPSPYKSIDLYKIIKRYFKFQSNKLDFVAQQLGVGAKVKHPGFKMWHDVMTGTEEEKAIAWTQFELYNKGDVIITEDVYIKVIPWIKSHPTVVHSPEELVCPRCGGADIIKTGKEETGLLEYDRYYCTHCGGWLKGGDSTRIQILRTI